MEQVQVVLSTVTNGTGGIMSGCADGVAGGDVVSGPCLETRQMRLRPAS